jgi:hypothetical protein
MVEEKCKVSEEMVKKSIWENDQFTVGKNRQRKIDFCTEIAQYANFADEHVWDSNWTSGYSQVYQKGRAYLYTCRSTWWYLGLLRELVLSILMKIMPSVPDVKQRISKLDPQFSFDAKPLPFPPFGLTIPSAMSLLSLEYLHSIHYNSNFDRV